MHIYTYRQISTTGRCFTIDNQKKKVFQILKITFPLLLLVLAIFEIQKAASGVDVNLLRDEVSQLQPWKLALIILFSFIAITPMFFYDVVLVKLLKIKMKATKLIRHSFIVNTFSNLIGFGGLIGLLLRSYFYSKYKLEKEGMLKNIASVTLFYLTGISLLAWIVPIYFSDFPLLTESKWLYIAVMVVCLYVPIFMAIYVIQNRKTASPLNGRIAVQLIMVSVFEWVAVFLVIWFLTFVLNIPIGFKELVPVFLIASCAGIISMIPGGIGSFDLVFLWGAQSLGILDEKVLVLLILYRISYFLLPFLFAVLLFVKEYWEKWNISWGNLPNVVAQKTSHTLLTVLIFMSGMVLLLSAAVPEILSRLKIAQEFLSLPIINVSHQLTVAAGFLLLGLCRGIEYKVKRTYQIAIGVLISAALFSLIKGFDYEEALFLLIVAFLLISSKSQFYRESYVITWGKALVDLVVVFIITAMYVLIGYYNLPSTTKSLPNQFTDYMITDYQDLFFSAIIGIIIALAILIVGYLIRKPRLMEIQTSIHQEEKILNHLERYMGNELTHLIFLHDKNVFWNKEETVLFSYQLYADKIIVLGNPVGEKTHLSAAIGEFMDQADRYGYTIAFYEVSNKVLASLHEYGYGFFKLGEEAFVDLGTFTLSGKRMKAFRAAKNKFEKAGFVVELIEPPFQIEFMKELKEVSKNWLQGRAEKGFSLGFFDEAYLNTSKVAVVRGAEGVIGFASVMPMYDNDERISVDLMRFTPGAPSGTMDFIFLSLFEWAKEEGYQTFNMGMSPLSNVGLSKFSFLSEKVAAQIFLHGQLFFHFKGLKSFKDKYADSWEPKYLAYRKKSSLSFTMTQIALMISKKRR